MALNNVLSFLVHVSKSLRGEKLCCSIFSAKGLAYVIYIRGVEEAASYGKVVLLRCYILPIIGYEFIIFMMHTHLTGHFSCKHHMCG